MKREPVRLEKKKEKKPLWDTNHRFIFGVPVEFIIMLILMSLLFCLIIMLIGPGHWTDSGNVYNRPWA